MASSTLLSALASAQLGISKPLCYGPVSFKGNLLRSQTLSDNSQVVFIGGGEGEWDGIDRIWVNEKLIDATDTTICHFHPGTETPLGSGLSPTSTGGDQLVDAFYNYFPSNQQRITFSGLAYVALKIAPDPQAPSSTPDWLIHARTCKIRSFDSSGTQLAYAYSKNYAWIILDLYLRKFLKVDALKGDALTSAEKARIDFSAVADAAAYCDAVLAGGQKRFEGGFAFTQKTSLAQAIDQVRIAGQLYVTDPGGILTIRADKPRTSIFTLTSSMIVANSAKFDKNSLRGATNRFNGNFRDSNPKKVVTIASVVRSGNVVTVTTNEVHPFFTNDDAELAGVSDTSFNVVAKTITVTGTTTFTFPQTGANASSSGGYVGTPESRFAVRSITLDHDAHQQAVAQRGPGLSPAFKRTAQDLDLGICTANQVQRILQFLAYRTLGPDASPFFAPPSCQVDALYYAYDAANDLLLGQLNPGEVLTIDKSISEEFQGDYEILDITRAPLAPADGSGTLGKIALTLLKVVTSAYSDSAPSDPDTVAGVPGRPLNGSFVIGSDGLKPILNTPLGSIPGTVKGSIAFTNTTSSIQWAPNLTIYREDTGQTLTTINTTQNVTGLSSGTAYNHYPFLDDRNSSTFDMVRTGGTGTPTWAHIGTSYAWTQEQARADHCPLSNVPLQASTTSSGTGSGSGGGDGTCNRRGTVVLHRDLGKTEIQNCRVGEYIYGPKGWRRIRAIELYENDTWIRVKTDIGEVAEVTPGHCFASIDGDLLRAASMGMESMIASLTGAAFVVEMSVVREKDLAVRISLDEDEELGIDAHLYYAGMNEPRLVSKNNIMPC